MSVIPFNGGNPPPSDDSPFETVCHSSELDMIDALNREIVFCRGISYSLEGVGHAAGCQGSMEGPLVLLHAHIDQLRVLTDHLDRSLRGGNMTRKIPIIDFGNAPTASADCVARVKTIGSVTHIIFTETRPGEIRDGDDPGRDVREVCLRLAVPTDCVLLMARAIMAGVTTPDWILPNEEDTAELRRH